MQINGFLYVSLILEIHTSLPLKVISHNPLEKLYQNLARMCKKEFYENKINLNWLKLLRKIYYVVTDREGGQKAPPPPPLPPSCQIVFS